MKKKLVDPLDEILQAMIKPGLTNAVVDAMNKNRQEADHLLTVREAATVLNVSQDWLYRNHRKLPFSRKLGPKMVRFSYHGLLRYLQVRKAN